MKVKVYSITNYSLCSHKFIENNLEQISSSSLLTNDKSYHFRIDIDIDTKNKYIFFGDLDHFSLNIQTFIQDLKSFLFIYSKIHFEEQDFKYTKNDSYNEGESYHFSIPTLYTDIHTLKSIMKHFIQSTEYQKYASFVDTNIYRNGWFRCPYQSKPSRFNKTQSKDSMSGKHIIVKGTINDFIIDYIPSIHHHSHFIASQNIPSQIGSRSRDTGHGKEGKSVPWIVDAPFHGTEQEKILSSIINKPMIYKNIFDNCYSQERFEKYEYWMSVGMGLKNIFHNEETAFQLFDYFSSKSHKYKGTDDIKNCFDKFICCGGSPHPANGGYTAATLYYYAKQDNKNKFIEIMNENTFELGPTDICKFIKTFAGNKFLYSKNFKLFCFNGKFWEQNNIEFRKYISGELYNFLKLVLVECFWNNREFNSLKSKLEKFKSISLKKELEETYKEYGLNETIKFDDKWFLFGFNNTVYDLQQQTFREYSYNDYVATTCGYDWREPTQEELNTVHSLIQTIIPDQEERELLLQILSTCLEGRCLEKFIIQNGSGGNGKSLLNDILLRCMGNYGMICNNAILYEGNRTGSNPEKANIHKKKVIIFREPSSRFRFNNGVIKEMTGSGMFSARGHMESNTEKELNNTTIVECNSKPNFEEEPTEAEIRRVIDIYFPSKFTNDKSLLDDNKNIYLANPEYKTTQFQENHKFAFFKILTESHKRYQENNYQLNLPQKVKERTQNYLELSCNILQWFKDNYEELENDNDEKKNVMIKLGELYKDFKNSENYRSFSKLEQRKYNQKYFKDFFLNDRFLNQFYYSQKLMNGTKYYSIILGWKRKNFY
jgi:phage/plasmid-associated DNA primase